MYIIDVPASSMFPHPSILALARKHATGFRRVFPSNGGARTVRGTLARLPKLRYFVFLHSARDTGRAFLWGGGLHWESGCLSMIRRSVPQMGSDGANLHDASITGNLNPLG